MKVATGDNSSSELTIRVPFEPRERRVFDEAMEKGHHFKGGWVKAAILEKLTRETEQPAEPKDVA